MIHSDLRIKSSLSKKKPSEVYLYEYLPLDKDDVVEGKGIDKSQNDVHFYDIADIRDRDLLF